MLKSSKASGRSKNVRPLTEALTAARAKRKVTQRELASRAGVAQGNLSRIEHGADSTLSTFVELTRALGYDLVMVPAEHLSTVRHLIDYAGDEDQYTRVRRRFE